MRETIAQRLVGPAVISQVVLTEILRDGAQRLLGRAIEAEVEGWREFHKPRVDEHGHRQVAGNGRLPTHTIVTGVGPVQVRQRCVRDRRIVGVGDDGDPIAAEPFEWTAFAFRSMAGVYLAGVFWVRGYASAAGAHAAYNVFLIALARLASSAA